jgi:mannose-6-phosphate isomerase-like protein (cupin superfamily)
MSRLKGTVKKGWGSENIWCSNDKYCGKILNFKEGAKFSMHFHAQKDETWYVLEGEFIVRYISTDTAEIHEAELYPGDTWYNPPLLPHQLICVKAGRIVEVSTPDSVKDNHRVMPGDSQK